MMRKSGLKSKNTLESKSRSPRKTYMFTFLISLLTLVDYSHGISCWYCLPCSGTNARLVACPADKNFCSLLRGIDTITGELVHAKRCEYSADAVSGSCYSNSTYAEYRDVQACLCNKDGCNYNETTFNITTTPKPTSAPSTATTATITTTSTTPRTTATTATTLTTTATTPTTTTVTTSTTTTLTTTRIGLGPTQPGVPPSGSGQGATTLQGATPPPGMTYPAYPSTVWPQPTSASAASPAVASTFPIPAGFTNQLTTWLGPSQGGVNTAPGVTTRPQGVTFPLTSTTPAGIISTFPPQQTPQPNASKAAPNLHGQRSMTMIVAVVVVAAAVKILGYF